MFFSCMGGCSLGGWLPGLKPRGAGAFVLLTEASDAKALKHDAPSAKAGID